MVAGPEIEGGPDPLRREVRRLLEIMSKADPHGGEHRHPEWPLQVRGDDDACGELVDCLNRLREMTQ